MNPMTMVALLSVLGAVVFFSAGAVAVLRLGIGGRSRERGLSEHGPSGLPERLAELERMRDQAEQERQQALRAADEHRTSARQSQERTRQIWDQYKDFERSSNQAEQERQRALREADESRGAAQRAQKTSEQLREQCKELELNMSQAEQERQKALREADVHSAATRKSQEKALLVEAQYRDAAQHAQERTQQLQDQCKKLERSRDQAEQERQQALAAAERAQVTATEAATAAQEQVQRSLYEVQQAREQLATARGELEALRERYQQATASEEALAKSKKQLEEALASEVKQALLLRRSKREQEHDRIQLDSTLLQLEQMGAQMKQMEQERDTLRQKVLDRERKRDDLLRRCQELETAQRESSEQVNRLQQQLNEPRETSEDEMSPSAVEALEQRVKKLASRISRQLPGLPVEHEVEITRLRQAVARRDLQILELQRGATPPSFELSSLLKQDDQVPSLQLHRFGQPLNADDDRRTGHKP